MCDHYDRKIKWSYATKAMPDRPSTIGQAAGLLPVDDGPPRANDVFVAEIVEIGRHTRIECQNGRKSRLFVGDLIGVVFGNRYATRQWRGRVPATMNVCHMLSVGGVCGEVVDTSPTMSPPTLVRPLGYVVNGDGRRLNLTDYGIAGRAIPENRPTVILVVGASMDSGKTTAAFSTVNGLSNSGARVCAAKLTGTACAKDLFLMEDAGAERVLDFTSAGYASTADCSIDSLRAIARAIIAELSVDRPDYLVLEIADGIVQRETRMLLRELRSLGCIDYTMYTCNDSMGVREGVRVLRDIGLNVVAISGWVACSPLATEEAQAVSELPILQPMDLLDPGVADVFPAAVRARSPVPGVLELPSMRAGGRPSAARASEVA